MDFFRGNTVTDIDVEALQYIINISAADPTDTKPNPTVHFRVHLIKTKKCGQKLPRVELEEMGPRIDFKIGRVQEANEDMTKLALMKSKALEAKTKKNIETDIMGDKMGKIHLGKQELHKMQTRKMKGLKRRKGEDDGDAGAGDDDDEAMVDEDEGVSEVETPATTPKKARTG